MTWTEDWKQLHGVELPAAISAAAPDAAAENARWRPADFLAQPNVFLEAVLAAQRGDRLPLWEPLANLVPVEALDDGDELMLHVPHAPGPLTYVTWDHERDVIDRALPGDLKGRASGDPANPLRFAARAHALVELLARGRLDLELFAQALDSVTVAVNEQLKGNVRVFPPTGLFIPWHLYLCGRDAEAAQVLEAAAQSPARFIRDSAALLRELLAGRRELGVVKDLPALRAEAAAFASDPLERASLLAAKSRAATDQRLASLKGPRLLRREAPAAPQAEPAAQVTAGDVILRVRQTARPPRTALVASRQGRVIAARDVAGGRLAPTEALEPRLFAVGQGLAALVQPFSPAAAPPLKGGVSVFRFTAGALQLVAHFPLDVTQLERHGGELVVRASDGSAYAFDGLEQGPAPGVWSPPPPGPLPGVVLAAAPAGAAGTSLWDLELALTPTSLVASRAGARLWEEPLVEAYALALLPARRLVAVHHLSEELRPVVDVLYVRDLAEPVAAGEGCASWCSFPVDGRDLELTSDGAHLFVREDGAWKQLDEAALATPPPYLKARGWL